MKTGFLLLILLPLITIFLRFIPKRKKIISIKRITEACPSQWKIKLLDGRMIYARYRWGTLSITISNRPTDKALEVVRNGRILFHERVGDDFDGWMSTEEMLKYLNPIINEEV